MPKGNAKPVIIVDLLPKEWGEVEFKQLQAEIVRAAGTVFTWGIKSEDDLIVLFPADRMQKGLGEVVPIMAFVPDMPPPLELTISAALCAAVKAYLPKAFVQCKVFPFETSRGFSVLP